MSSNLLLKWADNKYNRLLTLLLGLLVSIALPETQAKARGVIVLLFSLAMLSIIRRVRPGRWWLKFYSALVFLNVLLLGLQISGWFPIAIWSYAHSSVTLILLIMLGIPIWLLQQELFSTHQVTGDTLKGGIAIYILMGVAWALVYTILFDFDPSAFYGITSSQFQSDFLHFSFVTLTTVGYGNILPLSTAARVAADLEALTGVLYPTILISRLVSLYNPNSQEPL